MTHSNVFNHLPIPRLVSVTLVALTLTLAGCQSDSVSRNDVDPVNPVATAPANTNPVDTTISTVSNGNPTANSDQFRLELSATQFSLIEGETIANLNITVVRENGHNSPITLELQDNNFDPLNDLLRQNFSDAIIDTSESQSNLQMQLGVARGPIQPHQRLLNLVATDDNASVASAVITLNITPTSQPDVYLLIGQSNMVGASLSGARESGPGEADEPNPRIFQLNVTGNDDTNFRFPQDYIDPARVANNDAPRVNALDPLHDGFNFSIGSKSATRIGMGLSFAKAMLPNTTANIMLVPAAWSDTGFCQTQTSQLLEQPGLGWHATAPADTDTFAGTLLHDRALARLNFTLGLAQGGIFRGILWHQGEADSNDDVCAAAYQENLRALVASIRNNANEDLRGPRAQGGAIDVPFIAGTLSRGPERRLDELPPASTFVDNVHRNIPSFIPFADIVDNIDLIPPSHLCGDGSGDGTGNCIHFGATAYREMGTRYAERMQAVQQQ